ncbi:primase-helicase family protein [Vibrio parahaemolyticus]|uniref:primase-helicase family protein n=1 Tax=Vibrio parahaemolyticus TaxID=670 RepID=UPI0011204071|nr:primase-helicase family protein [Vibrio parahaemolyticus]
MMHNDYKHLAEKISTISPFSIKASLSLLVPLAKELAAEDTESLFSHIKKVAAKNDIKTTLPLLRQVFKTEIRKQRSGDEDFVDDYIYLTSIEKFMHKESKALMGHKAFNMQNDRLIPHEYAAGENIKAEKYAATKIECFEDCIYAPSKLNVFMYEGKRYYNSYREADLELVPEGTSNVVSLVKGHIKHLLSDKYEQDLLLYSLAHNVQNAGELKRWAVVLQGVQGDGKSFFAHMMSLIMGRSNVRKLNGEDLESNFTDWSEGQCLTFIEELRLTGSSRYSIVNKIKPYITNNEISVSIKGRSVKVVENTTNYIAFTNYRDAIPVDDEDRRWCVLFSNFQDPEKLKAFLEDNPSYYRQLYRGVNENAGEIRQWLLNLEIPQWFVELDRAPFTAAKQIMIESTKPAELVALEDAIKSSELPDVNELFVNLTRLAAECCDDEDFPSNRSVKNFMQQLGYTRLEGRFNREVQGVTKKCYFYAKTGFSISDLKKALGLK